MYRLVGPGVCALVDMRAHVCMCMCLHWLDSMLKSQVSF